MRILVAEDDARVGQLLQSRLKAEQIAADVCQNGLEALEMACVVAYDVLVLDIMMPKMDGLEVVRRLRGAGCAVPVIFLTARDTVEDRVLGLNIGADDYLVKPFAFDELLARIRVLTRRTYGACANQLEFGGLKLDLDSRAVTRDGQPLHLTSREYAILEYLMRNADIVLSRDRILDNVWNMDYEGVSNMVDVYIRNLRKKVDDPFPNKLIHTIRGMGYVMREDK